MPPIVRVRVVVLEATDLPAPPDGSLPSPFALVTIGGTSGETGTKPSTTEPVWNRPMVFSVDATSSPFLQVEIIDRNTNVSLGAAAIPLTEATAHGSARWYDLGGGSQVRLTVTQESDPAFARGAPIAAPTLTLRRPRPLHKHAARPFTGHSYRLRGGADNARPIRTRAAPLWTLIPAPGLSNPPLPPRTAAAEALAQLRSTPSWGPVVDHAALSSAAAARAADAAMGITEPWGVGVGGNAGVYGDLDGAVARHEDAAQLDILIDRATDARLGRGALYERPYGNDYATLAAYDRLLAAQDATRAQYGSQLRRYGPSCLPAAERLSVPISSSGGFERSLAPMGMGPLRAGLGDMEDDYAVRAGEGIYGSNRYRGGYDDNNGSSDGESVCSSDYRYTRRSYGRRTPRSCDGYASRTYRQSGRRCYR